MLNDSVENRKLQCIAKTVPKYLLIWDMTVVFPASHHSYSGPLPFLPNCDLIIYFNDKHSAASCTVKHEGHYVAFLQPALSVNHIWALNGQPSASSPYTQETEDGLDLVPREMLFWFTWCSFLPLQHGRTDSSEISPKLCDSVFTCCLLVVWVQH